MTKREFYSKALLAGVPIAARMYEFVRDDDPALVKGDPPEKISIFAGLLADELTIMWESRMVTWHEFDCDPENQADQDYVDSRANLTPSEFDNSIAWIPKWNKDQSGQHGQD